jgi:hypothetical protein
MLMDTERRIDIDTIADDFLTRFYPGDWARNEIPDSGVFGIRSDKVDDLAGNLHLFIAEVIAQILDAGSEREAVLENFDLQTELRKELQGWTLEGA